MDLASRDAELKAALFRFVDVVPPAATSTTSRATSRASCARSRSRRRRSPSRCGWAARAPAAPRSAAPPPPASSTWRTASSSARAPKAAMGDLRELWKDGVASSVDLLGEATVTQAEAAALRGRAARRRSRPSCASRAKWPARPQLERDSAGPAPAHQPVREGLRAHAAAAPRGARARQARRRRAPARPAAPGRASSARTCTSTRSRWTRATPCSSSCSSCSPRRSSARARRAGMVLQAYLRDSPRDARHRSRPG